VRYDIVSLHLYVVVLRSALRLQSIAVIPDCQVLSWQLDEEKNWKIYTVRQSYVHIIGVVRSNGDDSSTWCTTAFDRRPGNDRERNGPSVCPYLCVSIRLSVSPGAELVLGRFGSLLWDGRWTLWHPALKVWTLISIHHHLSAFSCRSRPPMTPIFSIMSSFLYDHIPRRCSSSSLSSYHSAPHEFLSLPFCLLRLYAEGIHFLTHDLNPTNKLNFSVFVRWCWSSFCFHPSRPKPID